MASFTKIFGNFRGGILSEGQSLDFESPDFKDSASDIQNFIITTQGSLEKRGGSKRVFDFVETTDDIAMKVFGDAVYVFFRSNRSDATTLDYIHYDTFDETKGKKSLTVHNMQVGGRLLVDFDFIVSPDGTKMFVITGGTPIVLSKVGDTNVLQADVSSGGFLAFFDQNKGGGDITTAEQNAIDSAYADYISAINEYDTYVSTVLRKANEALQRRRDHPLNDYNCYYENRGIGVVRICEERPIDQTNEYRAYNRAYSGRIAFIEAYQEKYKLYLRRKTNAGIEIADPGVGVFYQGRLCLAGFSESPNRIIASRSGNFNDFYVPNDLLEVSISDGVITIQEPTRIVVRFNDNYTLPIAISSNSDISIDKKLVEFGSNDGELLAVDDSGFITKGGTRLIWSDLGDIIISFSDPIDFEVDSTGDIKFLLGGKALHIGYNEGLSSIESGSIITSTNAYLTRQFSIPMGDVRPAQYSSGFLFCPNGENGLYYATYSRESLSWITQLMTRKASDFVSGIKQVHSYNAGSEKICCLLADGSELHHTSTDDDKGGWTRYVNRNVVSTLFVTDRLASQYSVVRLGDGLTLVRSTDTSLDYVEKLEISSLTDVSDYRAYIPIEYRGSLVSIMKNGVVFATKEFGLDDTIFELHERSRGAKYTIGFVFTSYVKTVPVVGITGDNVLVDLKKNYDISVVCKGSYPIINGTDTYKVDLQNPEAVTFDELKTIETAYENYSKSTSVKIASVNAHKLGISGIVFKTSIK